MNDPYDAVRESPVDFSFAVAYVTQPTVRRLLVLQLIGAIVLQHGVGFMHPNRWPHLWGLTWHVINMIDLAAFLTGTAMVVTGTVGLLLKLLTDANRLAA
ncbi:hypothetical protein SVXHr_2180 [Halorhabdus sp. SVX81]|uniref:hypothetical protein n=1 Tax=Halorhabdus sp. SVX81 TaxID=2978283 RepID=UPI0023DC17CF|nr:hypothetical protein [Halorhabdus sp. SVX81]WEL18335.1 hypothetical protein SVXHr_2180 [Halorhabdus sp. SVX81]